MSSIFDYDAGGSYDDTFPEPIEAQFPDDEDMEPGTSVKYMVRSDFDLVSLRGTKDAGEAGNHVVNVRVASKNSDYDGSGEVALWFKNDEFDGPWADIKKKQVASLARLVVAIGLVQEEAFDGTTGIDAVPIIIDAAGKYQGNYEFGGSLQFKKSCKDDGRVFMNHNLFFNKLPKMETPF